MFFKKKNKTEELIVYAPISGVVKPLNKVNDQVFSQEMMGPGVAITPENGKVYSPVEGIVKVAFPTGHAYGVELKGSTLQLLIHIGVDTVELNGEGFEKKVEQNKKVENKTLLCDFDLEVINKKAKSSDVMVIALQESLEDYKIEVLAEGKIKAGEPLFKFVKN